MLDYAALPNLTVKSDDCMAHARLDQANPSSNDSRKPATSCTLQPVYSRFPLTRQQTVSSEVAFADPAVLECAHVNVDARLGPFWSTVLPHRRVSLTIYPSPTGFHHNGASIGEANQKPLISLTISTDAQGQFARHVSIPWRILSTYTRTTPSIGAGNGVHGLVKSPLRVVAEILPEADPTGSSPISLPRSSFEGMIQNSRNNYPDREHQADEASRTSASEDTQFHIPVCPSTLQTISSSAHTDTCVSPPGGVRLISDLVSARTYISSRLTCLG